MSSRDKILRAIKANKPAEVELPAAFHFEGLDVNLTGKYLQVLQGIGGVGKVVNDLSEVENIIKEKLAGGVEVVSGLESIPYCNIQDYAGRSPVEIEKVDTAIMKGTIAVAENASIWMPERNLVNRLLPFVCQHLIIVIGEENIVATMHDAYDRISVNEDGYGTFIAGPSKTADIEQSLVIGAHGPVSLAVYIL